MTQKIIPVVRRAVVSDANLLAELGARSFYDTFARFHTAENIADYLAESFGSNIQAAELAERDGNAVGYAQLHVCASPDCVSGASPIRLHRIYVTQDCLGRGVGEALLRTCIEEATSIGHQTMWLGVWKKNTRAEMFNQKQNFRIVGEQVFKLGTHTEMDWIMELRL